MARSPGSGLSTAGVAVAAQLIQVVRHAHAGDREGWILDDDLRPLSERGIGQAERLAGQLAGARPQAVFSSLSLRCVGTVLPVARLAGLPLTTLEELHEGGSAAAMLVRLLAEPHQSVVACTHGDIVTDLLDWLVRAGVRLPSQRAEKASTWTIAVSDGAISSARYAPPP